MEGPPSRNARSGRGLEPLADLDDHAPLIRELARLQTGIEGDAVHADLKRPAGGGDQGDLSDAVLVRTEQLVRQTDGSGEVTSTGAIANFDAWGHFVLLSHTLRPSAGILAQRQGAVKHSQGFPRAGR